MKAGTTVTALFLSLFSPVLASQCSPRNELFPPKTRLFSQTVLGWNLLDLVWIRNLVNCDYKYGPGSRVLSVGILHFCSGLAPDIPKS
jgi:hypothetical protein